MPRDPLVHREVNDFIEALDSVTTVQECEATMAHTLGCMGFDRFAYAGGHLKRDPGGEAAVFSTRPICATHFHPEWAARYRDEQYFRDDPIVKACLNSSTPIVWTDRSQVTIASSRQDQIMKEAEDFHLVLGISIPAHGYKGEFGVFSATSSEPEKEFPKIVDAYGHSLHLAALYYHSTLLKKWPPRGASTGDKKLTPREIEVMQWVALGKTSWEISVILMISASTVNTHIEHIMDKFNVKKRAHAVAKAYSLGLIRM